MTAFELSKSIQSDNDTYLCIFEAHTHRFDGKVTRLSAEVFFLKLRLNSKQCCVLFLFSENNFAIKVSFEFVSDLLLIEYQRKGICYARKMADKVQDLISSLPDDKIGEQNNNILGVKFQ